jgi:hypothetical protein
MPGPLAQRDASHPVRPRRRHRQRAYSSICGSGVQRLLPDKTAAVPAPNSTQPSPPPGVPPLRRSSAQRQQQACQEEPAGQIGYREGASAEGQCERGHDEGHDEPLHGAEEGPSPEGGSRQRREERKAGGPDHGIARATLHRLCRVDRADRRPLHGPLRPQRLIIAAGQSYTPVGFRWVKVTGYDCITFNGFVSFPRQ